MSYDKKTRKLTRVGGSKSISVAIPINIVKDLHWREKQRVEVKRVPRGVMIRDAKSKKRTV